MSSTTLTAVWSGSHVPVHMSSSLPTATPTAAALGPPPVLPTTGTSTSTSTSSTGSLIQSPLRNKRCSSSSSLDCQSLQSSLKRVRLSCSPGELRLQRDLGCLPAMGWTPETDIQDDCMMDSPMGSASNGGVGGGPASTGSGTAARPFALESNPRWFLQSSNLSAELQLLDPLRLVLSIQRPQRCSRLWIQIPRMYPHRPPVISRIENMAMDQIVVLEETPGMPHGQDTSSGSPPGTTTTLYYKEWSPVRHLGDLLLFLLQASASSLPLSRSTSFATSVASTDSGEETSVHFTSSMTTEFASSSSSSSGASASSTSSPNDVSSSATTIHRRHASPAQFMDEHKMDDVFVCYKNKVVDCTDMAVQVLAPNRFDVGYGKYCNPLELQHRKTLQQHQQHDPNAMEM